MMSAKTGGGVAGFIKVSLNDRHAIEVTRIAIGGWKLVYVLTASKRLKYLNGESCVAYIGTTKNGIYRVASSAAAHADDILGEYGVRKITARIITCKPRPKVKTWMKLERALLLAFRERYGEVPRFNKHGHKIKETDEFEYFRRERLRELVLDLAEPQSS